MKVYKFREHSKAMNFSAVFNNDEHPIHSDFDGSPKQNIWTPIKLETLFKRTYKDFPYYIIGQPVVSKRVKELMEPFTCNEVEFLPLIHDDFEFFMVNVTNVLDCVDWQRSDFRTFDDGSWAGFNKLVFDFHKVPEDTYMFKINQGATTRVYVTEAFKDLIERNKLKGLDFSQVYDSDFTEAKELEQKRNYESALADIERSKGQEFSYEEAGERVGQGKAVASGKWKMQLSTKGNFLLGELLLDLTYQWIRPMYIPPILLDYLWHEVDKDTI
ncbi:hypothetical protein EJP82_16370 [Paenibacillus anaericanus]|uniref:Immunity MXAN-0049 protein domain-containing protein n=1 Tax=Paenibacillus anaericanus TaxID=170367 RepID=A0A433Y7A4_9BACL|nr:DUF1629 domain-containing protein [Paenibacillus anaericanus]RUT45251.1 hypothetical protein EJP82_16370 [Paenibacillus anaericanus]